MSGARLQDAWTLSAIAKLSKPSSPFPCYKLRYSFLASLQMTCTTISECEYTHAILPLASLVLSDLKVRLPSQRFTHEILPWWKIGERGIDKYDLNACLQKSPNGRPRVWPWGCTITEAQHQLKHGSTTLERISTWWFAVLKLLAIQRGWVGKVSMRGAKWRGYFALIPQGCNVWARWLSARCASKYGVSSLGHLFFAIWDGGWGEEH